MDTTSGTSGARGSGRGPGGVRKIIEDPGQHARDAARNAPDSVKGAAREAGVTGSGTADGSPLHRLGQVGYAAQGLVWIVVGWLALTAARGAGGTETATSSHALQSLGDAPGGVALLVVLAIGLACYGVWQLVEAAVGHRSREGHQRTAKRLGSAGKAVFAFVLTATAVALATGGNASGGGEEEGASLLLGLPGGRIILALIGVLVLGIGCYWVYSGATAKFREKLREDVPDAAVVAGRVGHLAKGAAFVVLGGLVILAAVRVSPEEAGGTASAFGTILDFPFGPVLLGAVAVGLIAFGLYQIAAARYLREG